MPQAEILTIGDELLSGEVVDTNSSYLDGVLSQLGWQVTRHTTVADDIDAIAEAMRETTARAELVISSGGLGPTEDDLTLEALAQALGCQMRLDQPTLDYIAERFKSFGREMTPNNARQANVPEIGEILPNEAGTAPGFLAPLGRGQIILLPGVPREVRWITGNTIEARFRLERPFSTRRSLKLIAYGESRLATDIDKIVRRHDKVTFGYRAIHTEVHLKLTCAGEDAAALISACEADLRKQLGDLIFGEDDVTLVGALSARLRAQSATVSVAESCTSGILAKMLTDEAGSSSIYIGGCSTYANEAKTTLLGVDADVISANGAVSEPVARSMAEGIRARLGTTWGLSTTGIAGPGGGSEEKPVGTVYVGLAGPDGTTVKRLQLIGDREMVRSNTAKSVLDLLRRKLGPL